MAENSLKHRITLRLSEYHMLMISAACAEMDCSIGMFIRSAISDKVTEYEAYQKGETATFELKELIKVELSNDEQA